MADQGIPPEHSEEPKPGPMAEAEGPKPPKEEDGSAGRRAEAEGPKPPIERREGGLTVRRQPKPRAEVAKPLADAASRPAERPPRAPKPKVERPRTPPPAPVIPDPVETLSFAELFERSGGQRPRYSPGQKMAGRIVQLGKDTAFIDLGGKGEALMEIRELQGEKGELSKRVGDRVEGYVRTDADGIWLTFSLPKGAQREALQDARAGGIPVDGTVTGFNKGGLEVDLGGGTRAFCPASQVDVRFVEELSAYVGQRLRFLVTELKDRDVVLSRRAFLAREAKGKAEELRGSLEVGAQFEGTVTSLRDFGAFVDLGGLEGLIPISELSHRHIAHPRDVLEVGQKILVEILRIEAGKDGKERIALSRKALEGDPWEDRGNALVEGQRVHGRVVRLQPFGAFVELFPGVDGLIHVSRLQTAAGHRATHPKDALAEGQILWVEVETLDRASRKIGLRPLTDEEAATPPPPRSGVGPRVGELLEVTVDKVESFGLFVRWPGGRGLVPASELGAAHGADLRRAYALGAKLKAAIVEIDLQGRIRLSKSAAEQAEERAGVAEYLHANQRPGKGLGTLADLLKGRKV